MIAVDMTYQGARIHIEGSTAEEVERKFKATIDLVENALDAQGLPSAPSEAAGLSSYKCHKIVWAGKILDLQRYGGNPQAARLKIGRPGDENLIVRPRIGWIDTFKGDADDLGYFVVYEDGYSSWSPSKAFENGYTRIE